MKSPETVRQDGSSLVVVLSVMMTLAITAGISIEYTTTIRRHVQRSDALQSAIAVGDGVLEKSFSYWREICRSNTDSALQSSAFASIPVPTQDEFPNIPSFNATTTPADLSLAHPPTVS